jgi:hypothetical protein
MASRTMRWNEHLVRMGEKRSLYIILSGKPEGSKPFGRWKVNIKIHLKEIRWKGMD